MINPDNYPDGIWLVRFASHPEGGVEGNKENAVSLVALDLNTGQVIRIGQDELHTLDAPPFGVGERSLVISFDSSRDIQSLINLDWATPRCLIDVGIEIKNMTNGTTPQFGRGLVGAAMYCGDFTYQLDGREQIRNLLLQDPSINSVTQQRILDVCEKDVRTIARLVTSITTRIDLPRALLRGEYAICIAQTESNGIPIDTRTWDKLKANWELIKTRFPEKYPSFSRVELDRLVVGNDGRNRTPLNAFSSASGRNQPSSIKSILGLPTWLRGLIQPNPGSALIYLDWRQQEFGIGAALSCDPKMQRAYLSSDPYLQFAIDAGAAPSNATRRTHEDVRHQYKSATLAVQFGMGAESLATHIGHSIAHARQLIEHHHTQYRQFWRFSDGCLNEALLNGRLTTNFGWQLNFGSNINPHSARNFIMQAHGAEMLRIACVLLYRSGMKVCATNHDAILIESPIKDLSRSTETASRCMKEASNITLSGFTLDIDVRVTQYPNRYQEDRGAELWNHVMEAIDDSNC